MVFRKDKKRKSYLGQRSRGKGNTKNRRGAGSRGGRGKAGRFSHKYSLYYMEDGTKRPLKAKKNNKIISICNLNSYLEKMKEEGKIKSLDKEVTLDFSKDKFLKKYDKIVGRGEVKYKLILKNVDLTKSLKDKIEKKGGKVE